MRDPFAVACQVRDRLTWAQQKALVLIVAQEPDGQPAAAYAAQVAAVLDLGEDAQEAIYAEAVTHRERLDGTGAGG